MPTQLFETGAADVLYLIDLSGYVFRAYHAIAPLSSPSGEPTHAVLGTVNMLERLVRQCKPVLLAVAMDSRTATFRKELFPEYKANRPPPPDDLRQQMRRVSELLHAFPLPCFQQDGFEADDLIATLVKQATAVGLRVVIVSADKDLMQLVTPSVILWDTMRDKVFGPEEVIERFGVPVAAVRDALALMGDHSDNVPGVPSVGPKTATELLLNFGTLEQLYSRLGEVQRKKLRETLEQYRDQAFISQKLVTLEDNAPLHFEREAVRFQRRATPELRALYAELGFQRHLATLDTLSKREGGDAGAPTKSRTKSAGAQSELALGSSPASEGEAGNAPEAAPLLEAIAVISEASELQGLLDQISPQQRVTLSLALDGTFPMTSAWVGLGLSLQPGHAVYVPIAHRYMGAPKQLSLPELAQFFEALRVKEVQLGVFDGESSLVVLQRHAIGLNTTHFDALIASYLLELDNANDLGRLAQGQLGTPLPSYPLPLKRGAKQPLLEARTPAEVAQVTGAAAEALQRLWTPLSTRLDEEELRSVYRDLDQPLSLMLAELEQAGVLLEAEKLRKLGREVGAQLVELERGAHQLLGREFNVNSPRQLEKILFDDLGLKPIKRTKTSRSTDAETLESLAEEHELPKKILEIRQLAKLKGTYIDALPELVNKQTGRLHTHWHQEIAATGRLSSTDPNLQNIPIRTELGRRIRETFIAKPGHLLISADYSQIELRVLAHLSKDQTLLDAFCNGQDIHTRTAMEIFELAEADVTSEHRRRAKAVNFGVIYGQGDSALSKSLGISKSDAGQFIAAYFRRYSGVTEFMQSTLQSARASSSVRTLLGRRRLVPDIHSGNRATRLAAERIVMNTPIQGTAADLLKLAMLRLRKPVTPGALMLLSVHDELVFEVPESEVEEAKQKIRESMEGVSELAVPLVVDVGSGPNWRTAH